VASEERMIINSVSMGQRLDSNFCFGMMMIINNINTYALLNLEKKLMHVITGALVYDTWLMMILKMCDSGEITYLA